MWKLITARPAHRSRCTSLMASSSSDASEPDCRSGRRAAAAAGHPWAERIVRIPIDEKSEADIVLCAKRLKEWRQEPRRECLEAGTLFATSRAGQMEIIVRSVFRTMGALRGSDDVEQSLLQALAEARKSEGSDVEKTTTTGLEDLAALAIACYRKCAPQVESTVELIGEIVWGAEGQAWRGGFDGPLPVVLVFAQLLACEENERMFLSFVRSDFKSSVEQHPHLSKVILVELMLSRNTGVEVRGRAGGASGCRALLKRGGKQSAVALRLMLGDAEADERESVAKTVIGLLTPHKADDARQPWGCFSAEPFYLHGLEEWNIDLPQHRNQSRKPSDRSDVAELMASFRKRAAASGTGIPEHKPGVRASVGISTPSPRTRRSALPSPRPSAIEQVGSGGVVRSPRVSLERASSASGRAEPSPKQPRDARAQPQTPGQRATAWAQTAPC